MLNRKHNQWENSTKSHKRFPTNFLVRLLVVEHKIGRKSVFAQLFRWKAPNSFALVANLNDELEFGKRAEQSALDKQVFFSSISLAKFNFGCFLVWIKRKKKIVRNGCLVFSVCVVLMSISKCFMVSIINGIHFLGFKRWFDYHSYIKIEFSMRSTVLSLLWGFREKVMSVNIVTKYYARSTQPKPCFLNFKNSFHSEQFLGRVCILLYVFAWMRQTSWFFYSFFVVLLIVFVIYSWVVARNDVCEKRTNERVNEK